jgi:hypothetical protein
MFRFHNGVIPKLRAFISGPRACHEQASGASASNGNLARNQVQRRLARDLSLRLERTAPLKMTHL